MRDDQKLDELSLTRAVCIGGQTVVFNVRSTGLIKSPRLKYTLSSDRSLTPGVRDAVVDRIGFFLSLADDLEQFYRIGYGDMDFAPLLQKFYGLHQVKFLTPFESACWAVLSQRYPAAAAQRTKQAIMEKFGTSLEMNGQRYLAFPEPYRLTSASERDLLAIINNQRKTQFLAGVAKAFTEKDERFLRTAKYEQVEEWLSQIQGIGAQGFRPDGEDRGGETIAEGRFKGLRSREDHDSERVRSDGGEVWTLERVLGILSENSGHEILRF